MSFCPKLRHNIGTETKCVKKQIISFRRKYVTEEIIPSLTDCDSTNCDESKLL